LIIHVVPPEFQIQRTKESPHKPNAGVSEQSKGHKCPKGYKSAAKQSSLSTPDTWILHRRFAFRNDRFCSGSLTGFQGAMEKLNG